MTATEAYKKSLWKQLPNEIIEMINKKIEIGGTYVTLYKSVHPVFFYNKNKYIDILKTLDYIINLETVMYTDDSTDEKLIISWYFTKLDLNIK